MHLSWTQVIQGDSLVIGGSLESPLWLLLTFCLKIL